MTLRILIVVTHLLGAGHLTRAAAIGRALARRGHRVTLVSGGTPTGLVAVEGLDLVPLPPVRTAVGDFSTLLDAAGRPIGPDHLPQRRRVLLATLGSARPDVVVTELYPFGRRSLRAEFVALLEAAATMLPRPLILASIRDILVPPDKPEKVAATHATLAAHFRAVLVHGDEILPLDRSWPVDAALRAMLLYTGYVGPEEATPRDPSPTHIPHAEVLACPAKPAGQPRSTHDRPASFEAPLRGASQDEEGVRIAAEQHETAPILVSGGSSAASLPLYRVALAAAARLPGRPWLILVGTAVDEAAFQSLRAEAPDHVRVERARLDFRSLLAEAAVFVGQAGYNTIMDIVATQARSVLVPFEQGSETEQRLRADALAGRGLATVLPEDRLDPDALLAAISDAEARPRPDFAGMKIDGQERSAILIERLASGLTVAEARI